MKYLVSNNGTLTANVYNVPGQMYVISYLIHVLSWFDEILYYCVSQRHGNNNLYLFLSNSHTCITVTRILSVILSVTQKAQQIIFWTIAKNASSYCYCYLLSCAKTHQRCKSYRIKPPPLGRWKFIVAITKVLTRTRKVKVITPYGSNQL